MRLLRAKLLFDAMNAPTQLKSKVSSSSPTTSILGDLASLSKLASSTPGMDLAAQLGNLHSGAVEDRVLKNASFMKKSKKSFKYIDSTKTKQISPYELKTGSIIPGVLITALNSELPGQVLGQVSENVYDTATGEHLLIPQGTKMIGVYSADVVYGQERLLVAWNRLVFPDGQTLNIGSMNGTDGTGAGGFADQVNNHYFQVFGSAFLLTLFNGDMTVKNGELVILQQDTNTERKETSIEKQASAVIEKQMDIAPVIEIRSGYQFNIFVTKDIILEPLSD
ncbi:MAG: TrbI/VirB10 family protein [Sulfurovum sp.]|nr:TrbI/VirB10 family protein [Sulfurovum sp.]